MKGGEEFSPASFFLSLLLYTKDDRHRHSGIVIIPESLITGDSVGAAKC
jgi:hypothetical protein